MELLDISRITTRVAAVLSVALALSFPACYFMVSYQFNSVSLAAEAESCARQVSGIISANPYLWRFEQVRLEEILVRRSVSEDPGSRRILDHKGVTVAEKGSDPGWLALTRSQGLLDAGIPAGRIEIRQSLGPLLDRTMLAALLGLVVGYLAFRVVPYREIVRAQKRLQDGHSFLNTVMESSTNAIVVLDLAGGIRMANRRSRELSGYQWQELSGRHYGFLLAGAGRERMAAALAEISGQGARTVSFEAEMVRRDAGQLALSCGIGPFHEDGVLAGFVLCAEDTTVRKRWEQQLQSAAAQLEQSNTEVKSFAYIISHDLRAPLVNIRGFSAELNGAVAELTGLFRGVAEQLEQRDRERIAQLFEQEVPEALDFINSSVLRMDRLVGSVLKLSRLGHRELKVERVPVAEMVAAILKTMSYQIELRNAQVHIGELPVLESDRIALELILGNLLDNAVKYLHPGRPGRLDIFSATDAGGTVIHVRDNGRGIAPEDQEKVFELFRRAGRQDVQGEGMGLAYVKAMVRKLHGQIGCVSEPDCGSTFSFSIPAGSMPTSAHHDKGEHDR
jgi:PAS domain S-box-containing protein